MIRMTSHPGYNVGLHRGWRLHQVYGSAVDHQLNCTTADYHAHGETAETLAPAGAGPSAALFNVR